MRKCHNGYKAKEIGKHDSSHMHTHMYLDLPIVVGPLRGGLRMSCKHVRTTYGADRAFTAPVYTPGVTPENRAAHGNVVYTEECADCHAQRLVASNAGIEVSAWKLARSGV